MALRNPPALDYPGVGPALIIAPDGRVSLPDLPPLPDGARGWAVYARLSAKKYGRARQRRNNQETVERQIADIRAFAALRGMLISEKHVFVDNHLSAWKENDKRPGFDSMIAAAARGEVVGILVWKIDRFTRRTRDALMFTEVAEKHHVLINGPHSGEYDLNDPDERKRFRDDASNAEHESDSIGTRVGSRLAAAKQQGMQLGPGRTFGFEVLSQAREFDDDVMPIQRPAEVAIIREMARRFLEGGPANTWAALAADLNERGILTSTGHTWKPNVLARVVRHPRNAGCVTKNRDEIIGTMPDRYPNGDPYVPILDAETYARLQGTLMADRSKRGRLPSGSYPLTGTMVCGRCAKGITLAGAGRGKSAPSEGTYQRPADSYRRYVCPQSAGGCGMSVRAADVEAIVRAAVIERAVDPRIRAEVAKTDRALDLAREELRRQLAAAEAEVRRLDEQLSAVEVRHLTGDVRERAYHDMKKTLDNLIAKAEARRRELLAELGDAPGGDGDVPALTTEEWDAMTGEEQRDMVRRLRLRVTVYPPPPRLPGARSNAFDPRRIVIE